MVGDAISRQASGGSSESSATWSSSFSLLVGPLVAGTAFRSLRAGGSAPGPAASRH